MYLLSSSLKQRLIGGILHQRMLERVGRLRRNAAPKNQLRLFELLQGAFEPRLLEARYGSQ
jgi:hypothetical protein